MAKFDRTIVKIRRAIKAVERINEPVRTIVLEKLLAQILLENDKNTNSIVTTDRDSNKFDAKYIG